MKRTLMLTALVFLLNASSYSQILKPITWSYVAKKMSATEATLYIKASLEKGWHLYSQNVGEGGPVATSFYFPASKLYDMVGRTIEPKPIKKFEPVFMMEVSYFETTAIFQQKVKLKGKQATVKGSVKFMVCNDKQCLPPSEIFFSIPVK
ncbi:protein-disulfide reductase DsbD domain-containing protein [Pedobacter steynii]|uniref:Sugar transporter n=1 Tax=Pedobacter steynii TaxID=430522 RepID=A0A1D7QKZ7_9SPHI|nr:protein-disulfide reductase DsbD domain-containing protein [Pedobacter steynii]AOM79346.1 sugar transporter [Pedobacter steynii]